MGKLNFSRFFRLFLVLFIFTLFTFPTSVYASTNPHISRESSDSCHAMLVHLNKMEPATTTCSLTEAQYQANIVASLHSKTHPNISNQGCSNGNALWLYQLVNSGGPCIGFIGNGTAFLTNYKIPGTGGISWNDHVSSFFSGCSNGLFGEDANLTYDVTFGYASSFNVAESDNFPHTAGPGTVRNFTLTSILLNSNCGA